MNRDITPEQAEREFIFHSLYFLRMRQSEYDYLRHPSIGGWWIHVTDLQMSDGVIDLESLINKAILFPVKYQQQPQGDWRDRFHPSAYVLLFKGEGILHDPFRWIYHNHWEMSPVNEKRMKQY